MGQPACFQRKGQQSHALRTYLQHQKAEAAEVVSACLFNSGAARQQDVISTIYGGFQHFFPGCVVKGGAAFQMHMQAISNTLPDGGKGRLESLLRSLRVTEISDVDIACPKLALADKRKQMVAAIGAVARALGEEPSFFATVWPDMETRLRRATTLRRAELLYNATSYHDGRLHPVAEAGAQHRHTPVAGTLHASLVDFTGSVHCLGRLNICLENAKHQALVNVPFCDVIVSVGDAVCDVSDDSDTVVYQDTGLAIEILSLPQIFDHLRRMVFEETYYHPWLNYRFATKVCTQLARAFATAFVLDARTLPHTFSAAVDAWHAFVGKEEKRGSPIHKKLAYLGLGGQNGLDVVELQQQWRSEKTHLAALMTCVLRSCVLAPHSTAGSYDKYVIYLARISWILDLLDAAYGCQEVHLKRCAVDLPRVAAPRRSGSTFAPSMKAFALCLPQPLRSVESVVALLWEMLVDGTRRCEVCEDRGGLPTRLTDGMWTLHCPLCHAIHLESLADA